MKYDSMKLLPVLKVDSSFIYHSCANSCLNFHLCFPTILKAELIFPYSDDSTNALLAEQERKSFQIFSIQFLKVYN